MNRDIFDILFLIARPAAGKSEIIDYLEKAGADERRRRFHIGPFDVLDDFPMLWTWFEEDIILEEMGHPRLHTDADGYFKHKYLWHLLIRRLALEHRKLQRDRPPDEERTTVVEFSRGSQHGGYQAAFQHVPVAMLQRGAVVYVHVSFEESLRKNRQRSDPERPDSILAHSLPDEKLIRLYREDDWETFSAKDPRFIPIQGVEVPYAVFENEDDVTTDRGPALGARLEEVLDRLWAIKQGNA